MNNETNRLAQLIATAADKELGTRPDGQPRRQDKAAALAIEAEYLFIRRSELPTAEIVDRDGVPHVDVGSDAGTWSCKTSSADYARKTGLEYLAAAEAIREWRESAEREANRIHLERRNNIALHLTAGLQSFEEVPHSTQLAIIKIIELEGKAA